MTIPDEDLRVALPKYHDVLVAQSARARARSLVELDAWVRKKLQSDIVGREDGHLTRGELCRLMEWKLSRGKWRPRLEQLIATNSEQDVLEATRSSAKLLLANEPAGALKILTSLKGVGPATGSAIIALQDPTAQAFMSDECMEALGVKREYTQAAWLAFGSALRLRIKTWGSPEEFERAAFAAVAGKRLGVLQENETAPKAKRRKVG